jgi:5'-nucleotidase
VTSALTPLLWTGKTIFIRFSMRILIVNDDGYKAEGINYLADRLHKEHTVTMVAPRYGCSGFSHSLTFYRPIFVKKIPNPPWECYSVEGTPADCVKVALRELMSKKPDLIISGINNHPNIGTDVFYSGTVHAAMEGSLSGFPSLAVSGYFVKEATLEADMKKASDFIARNLDILYEDCKNLIPVNLNFPRDINDIKGVKVTPIGVKIYADFYERNEHIQEDVISYTLKGDEIIYKDNPLDCDTNWHKLGYITISPVALDNTDYNALKKLRADYIL